MGFPGNGVPLEERRSGVEGFGFLREMFRLLLLGAIVFDDILLCMKKKVDEEYNMKNEDTQDFFVNFILIFKHPVGG
jgi:hypothetical protein